MPRSGKRATSCTIQCYSHQVARITLILLGSIQSHVSSPSPDSYHLLTWPSLVTNSILSNTIDLMLADFHTQHILAAFLCVVYIMP